MVFPLAIAGLFGAHALRFGITAGGLRTGMSQFASSLPFGAGYSLGTYLGFPGNYASRNRYQKPIRGSTIYNTMPYGRYGRSRYPSRRYSRYPRRSTYSRFSRYRPRYRRSYY